MRLSVGWITAAAAALTTALYAGAVCGEQPVGALEARIVSQEGSRALSGLSVMLRPLGARPDVASQKWTTDARGSIRADALPAGSWTLEVFARSHKSTSRTIQVAEAETTSVELSLQPDAPHLRLDVHERVQLPGRPLKIGLTGFRQGAAIELALFRLSGRELHEERMAGVAAYLSPLAESRYSGSPFEIPPLARVVRRWTHTVRSTDGEGTFYDHLRLEPLLPGLYILTAKGGNSSARCWFLQSDLGLITKAAGKRMLVYAVELVSGRPVPGASIHFPARKAGPTTVVTDSRGLADISPIPARQSNILFAWAGESLAFHRTWPLDTQRDDLRVHLDTDRPVYRPGHRVRVKGIARRPTGSGYAFPTVKSGTLRVLDWQETELAELPVTLTASGSFAAELTLPAETATGYTSLELSLGGQSYRDGFQVAAYRKPEWEVDVAFERDSYISGEPVYASVLARYYYGAPVARGEISYTIQRSRYWAWSDDEVDTFTFEDEGYAEEGGEFVAYGDAKTDENGEARIPVDTTLPPGADRSATYLYTVEVDLTDESGRSVTGRGSVPVSPASLMLNARPSVYVAAPGKPVRFEAVVTDLERKPAAGVAVEVKARIEGPGRPEPLTVSWEGPAVTDEKGRMSVSCAAPTPGLMVVQFSVRDPAGRLVEASADVWLSTYEGGDFARTYPTLAVVPDRKLYRIGDTARLLLNTDRPGATALLAVEAEGIRDYSLVPLTRRSTVVDLPVKRGYEPNVFVHVCFVRSGEFVQSEAQLRIDPESHRLTVSVESDRSTYHPRETAVFRVRTSDAGGRPVSAELSFGVVDEAVYAIKEDDENALWKTFYPMRWNGVNTEFSYPAVYLGGDGKDTPNADAIRRDFPDTAYWNPFVRTGPDGTATVSVRLPDSLTRWRATAIACTADARIGEARHSVEVMRELTCRLQTPRSAVEGDRFALSAVVHNYSGGPLEGAVRLVAEGLQVRDAGERRFRLAPGVSQRVEWEAAAGTAPRAKVSVLATAGAYADGMELGFPVRPFIREEIDFQTSALKGESASFPLRLFPDRRGGELEIRASPTVAGPLLDGLEYLAAYPYGCTEQTMSAFLPDVAISQALKKLRIPRPDLAARLPEMVRAGLTRLYGHQQPEGGWGWWHYGEEDFWMTAYVLYGLQQAQAAGFEVNPRVLGSGLDFAVEAASQASPTNPDGPFLALALAQGGRTNAARALLKAQADHIGRMPVRSRAFAALAHWKLGTMEDRAAAARLVTELWSRSVTAAGMRHWAEDRRVDPWSLPADTESTAVALLAALRVQPGDARLAGVIRWLLLERRGSRWHSTRDTAWIILAASGYLQATGELSARGELAIRLGQRELRRVAAEAGEEGIVLRLPSSTLGQGEELRLQARGDATFYYAVTLRQTVPVPSFSNASTVPGASLARGYHLMETRRDRLGRILQSPALSARTEFKAGDRLMVRLTVQLPTPMEFVMIEDPLPPGFEVQTRGDVPYEEWSDWWDHMDVRDDRVALFARRLAAGKHHFEYYVRPEVSGVVRALPATLTDMYVPSTRITTGETSLQIKP